MQVRELCVCICGRGIVCAHLCGMCACMWRVVCGGLKQAGFLCMVTHPWYLLLGFPPDVLTQWSHSLCSTNSS